MATVIVEGALKRMVVTLPVVAHKLHTMTGTLSTTTRRARLLCSIHWDCRIRPTQGIFERSLCHM
jgi:hypothetical protein